MPPLAYLAATASFALALATLAAIARGRRTPAHYAFALGMAVLGVESLLIGQLNATWTEPEYLRLIAWRHALLALIPAPWLAFSIAYSRGNAREYLQRWRWPLLGMFVLPIALLVVGRDQLVGLTPVPNTGGLTVPVLGLTGFGLHLVALVTSVLILSNLERTFRSAIGTLRWRIKLTMIGLVVLFGCRIYTGSQALLYRSIHPPLELLNCGALIIACGLVAASVVRTKVFAIELYPSPAVLRHSLTLVLAGAYLLIVGVLARIVTALGGTTAFPAQAFLVLIALVGLTLALMSDRVRQHLQRFVSRHLRRPSYDYRQTWLTFSQRLSPQVTVPGLVRRRGPLDLGYPPCAVRHALGGRRYRAARLRRIDRACGRPAPGTAPDGTGPGGTGESRPGTAHTDQPRALTRTMGRSPTPALSRAVPRSRRRPLAGPVDQ